MEEDHDHRRVVSSERQLLLKAYEEAATYRARALAADNLWMSLSPTVRHRESRNGSHNCGAWLQGELAGIDEKLGLQALTPTTRYQLKSLLLKEKGIRGNPGRNFDAVWRWLDLGEVTPSQLKNLVERAEELMLAPGAGWAECLEQARSVRGRRSERPKILPTEVLPEIPETECAKEEPIVSAEPANEQATKEDSPKVAKKRPPRKESRRPKAKARSKKKPPRISIEKTLQYQQLKKIVDDAPLAKDLPVPDGVDAATYREAYSEMLENVRVVLTVASHDFFNAKRRHCTTEISAHVGVLAKACRTLRIAVPAPGKPVDHLSARRKWLEVVKTYHPDTLVGLNLDPETRDAKAQVFDAVNKAFETVKEYNLSLEAKAKEG